MKYINYKILIISFLFFAACSSEDDLVEEWIAAGRVEIDPPDIHSGDLDLSNYIAVGNSLTAGFADGALSPNGQANSYVSLLAQQFQLAGGGAFVVPEIVSGNGFGRLDGAGNPVGRSFIDLIAAGEALGGTGSFAEVIKFTPGAPLTPSPNTGASLNNFGVPGAKVNDITDPKLTNPFFAAFASSAGQSILDDAVSANASFFTLWIGSNDVLSYALSGGDTPNAAGTNAITPSDDFQLGLGTILTRLTENGAKGAVLTVPPVTLLPFFRIITELFDVGVNLITIGGGELFLLNNAYKGYNDGLDVAVLSGLITQSEADLRRISFTVGLNPPVITDESLTEVDISLLTGQAPGTTILPQWRQARADATTGALDLFLLTALDSIGVARVPSDPETILGVSTPLPDPFTLTIEEQVAAITAYATFNAIIEGAVATNPNLVLVDIRPLFADMFGLTPAQAGGLQLGNNAMASADGTIGLELDGFTYFPLELSTETIYHSVWSTDGVHPNGRGAALVTNEIITVLNREYNASIPYINPLDIPPIHAPF